MVGIVVVSHSAKLAQAAIEFVSEMKSENFELISAAGINEGKDFGSDPMIIVDKIKQANQGQGVLIICDLGSSVMNTQMAIEFLEPDLQKQVKIANAPFLEGLLTAVVSNNEKTTLETLLSETEATRNSLKF